MIQRIQSLFLLVAFILQLLMLFLPVSEYTINGSQGIIFKASGFVSGGGGMKELYQTTIILIFICLTVILPLITLFLFKRRVLQMRLCIYNIILLLGFQGVLFWFIWWRIGIQFEVVTVYKFPVVFPVVSAILSYLAFRAIKKDENLVRSLDRIR